MHCSNFNTISILGVVIIENLLALNIHSSTDEVPSKSGNPKEMSLLGEIVVIGETLIVDPEFAVLP